MEYRLRLNYSSLALPVLFTLLVVMFFNFFLLRRELSDFYALIVEEEVWRVKSVVEGTLSAGGDPVEALSYYLEHSKLLRGAVFYLEGREVVVPSSEISERFLVRRVNVKPFEFKIFIDTSYLEELNWHIKIIVISLLVFLCVGFALIYSWMRKYYNEKLKLEREKREKERIKTINLVVQSILHEVKNRLHVLNLLAYKLIKTGNLNLMNQFKNELFLLNRYIEETADLRRTLKLNKEWFEVSSLFKDLEKRISFLASSQNVQFLIEYQESSLCADYDRLLSALTDLVKNGLEALGDLEGGILKVVGYKDSKFYVFRVMDNAGKELPEGLFLPFKTTKSKGFGLSLFNVKRVAEAHGGEAIAYKKGNWTVFELKIPLSSSE